ncbi:MAG: efflux RND transporter periplasmic adaptor subunit [Oligoflexia bacterium]|nr:efflux RND transporter periplasmic adaptor subunit [Oligoflexia bacterium]
MKKICIFTLSYILLISSSLYLGTLTSCSKHNSTSDSSKKEITSYWTCSMHPQIKQDAQGKCPICGMDLIKVGSGTATDEKEQKDKSDEGESPRGHGTITLSKSQQEMIGVKYSEVVKKQAFKHIDTAGRVAFDPELFTAQNEYLEALRQAQSLSSSPLAEIKRSSREMVESAKMRLKILGLSNQQISAINDSSSISTGILIPKKGERIWVYAEVYEMDLSFVKPKMKANISGHSLEDKTLIGEVASVDRVINPVTRTAKVRIALPQTSLEIRPESYVEVSIISPLGEQLIVPFDAVLDSGKESWVFVVKNDNKTIVPRKVIVKSYLGDEVTIAKGLSVGEKIVSSANFLVDSESRLVGVREDFTTSNEGITTKDDSDSGDKKNTHKKSNNKITCPEGKTWHEQMNHCM